MSNEKMEAAIEKFKSKYPNLLRDATYKRQLLEAFEAGYKAASADRRGVVEKAFKKVKASISEKNLPPDDSDRYGKGWNNAIQFMFGAMDAVLAALPPTSEPCVWAEESNDYPRAACDPTAIWTGDIPNYCPSCGKPIKQEAV